MISKKSQALQFLLELLLLLGFISVVFFAGEKLVTNSDKYLVHDVNNLAIFMERLSTVNNSFSYPLKFLTPRSIDTIQSLDVKISDNKVFLDISGRDTFGYQANYYLSSFLHIQDFSGELLFKNVRELYFTKIGETIFITSEPVNQNILRERAVLNIESYQDISVFSENNLKSAIEGMTSFSFSDYCLKRFNFNSDKSVNIFFDKSTSTSKTIFIYYTLSTKGVATTLYNYFQEEFVYSDGFKDKSLQVSMVPFNEFSYVIDNFSFLTDESCRSTFGQSPSLVLTFPDDSLLKSGLSRGLFKLGERK